MKAQSINLSAQALRDNSLQPHLAGVPEDDIALRVLQVLVQAPPLLLKYTGPCGSYNSTDSLPLNACYAGAQVHHSARLPQRISMLSHPLATRLRPCRFQSKRFASLFERR